VATLLSCLYRLQEDGFTHLRGNSWGDWWHHDQQGVRPIADVLVHGLRLDDGPPMQDPPAAIDHEWHVTRRPAPGLRFMSRRTPEYTAVRLDSHDPAGADALSRQPRPVQPSAPPIIGPSVWHWLRHPAV